MLVQVQVEVDTTGVKQQTDREEGRTARYVWGGSEVCLLRWHTLSNGITLPIYLILNDFPLPTTLSAALS